MSTDENQRSGKSRDLVGLALSGGGIRSALYNDGFLQALSHRGFLRYVDYLASVSGGGYIAGHLASCGIPEQLRHNAAILVDQTNTLRQRANSSEPCRWFLEVDKQCLRLESALNGVDFEAIKDATDSLRTALEQYKSEVSESQSPQRNQPQPVARDTLASRGFHNDHRYKMGRDPQSGRVNSRRFAEVGGYLNHSLRFLPRFVANVLVNGCFYFGLVGIFATLAALFWRSFDESMFRFLLLEVLDLQFGDELAIAFYPTFFFVFLCFLVLATAWVVKFVPGLSERNRERTMKFRDCAWNSILPVAGICSLISIAIFLGTERRIS